MGNKKKILKVQDIEIRLYQKNEEDYICLTDMMKAKDGDFYITDWLRNRNTLAFLEVWERYNNPNFNYGEFAIIKNQSGLNSFKISVKEFVEKTNAIGIEAKTGRYGGTYAHKDIAFEFGMWISADFKFFLIKDYQRLKEEEANKNGVEWDVKRVISKANYTIHTNAIQQYIIPNIGITQKKEWIYADEADMLNIIIFGCTAKQWREANMDKYMKGENIRDMADINTLTILSNLESYNAILIKRGLSKKERAQILSQTYQDQKTILENRGIIKPMKQSSKNIKSKEKLPNDDFDKGIDKIIGFEEN
ncbi:MULTISPECIES: KilA-N domain-containing protein [Phocaeicola]|uniref:KilA-N domain-containing protein n=1 Tax=Phocaeicola TaxID=909656 RepID=UPI000E50CA7C|nr:KilA-N domain-containing protein [Phocaeicola vulgatus]RHL98664.1 KilA-N domain-containing protein [Phocaeicola vulgatus]